MKHENKLQFLLILVLTSFILFNSKGGEAYSNTRDNVNDGVVLTALTRYSSNVYNVFESAFLAQNPAVDDIVWLEMLGHPSQWISVINQPSYSIDFVWGNVQGIFDTVADAGYLIPIQNQTLTNYIHANVSTDIGGVQTTRTNESGSIIWVGSSLTSYGFIVNHDSLALNNLTLPQTWQDLASPEYFLDSNRSALCMANAPESTSHTSIYQFILQKYGWEYGWNIITRMAGNAEILDYSSSVRDSVINGEHAIGLAIDRQGYQAEFENPSCEYIIPVDGSLISVEPIAVASSSSGEDLIQAEAFINFVLSPEGQALWLNNAFKRIPIVDEAFSLSLEVNGYERPDLYEDYIKLHNISGFSLDFALAQEIYDIVTFYFEGALTQSSQELHTAWEQLVLAYKDNTTISQEKFLDISRSMSKPGISLAEALALQLDYQSDPNIKNSLITNFRSYAKNNYGNVAFWLAGNETYVFNSPTNGVTVTDLIFVSATVRASNVSYVQFILCNSTDYYNVITTISSDFVNIEFWAWIIGLWNGEYTLVMNVSRTGGLFITTSILLHVENSQETIPSQTDSSSTITEPNSTTSTNITSGFFGLTSVLALSIGVSLVIAKRKRKN